MSELSPSQHGPINFKKAVLTAKRAEGLQFSPFENQPPNVELDERGDAWLVVKGESSSTRFRVSTRVLSLASEYFKDFFNRELTDAAPAGHHEAREVVLEGQHDPTAMNVLLSMLHHRYLDLSLRPCLFEAVVRLSNKFQCDEVMTPWYVAWSMNLDNHEWDWCSDDYIAAAMGTKAVETYINQCRDDSCDLGGCGLTTKTDAGLWIARAACQIGRGELERFSTSHVHSMSYTIPHQPLN